jgi:hypothetical protein
MADDELKAVLAKLVDKVESEAAENARFRAENARFQAEIRTEFHEFRVEVRNKFEVVNTHLTGIDKRLDEQSRYIAALIPTKVAAVGR